MLTPRKPDSSTMKSAEFDAAMVNYKADLESMQTHPHNWGVKDKAIVKTVIVNKGSNAETAALLDLEKKKVASLEKELNSERSSALVESDLKKLNENELSILSKKRLEDYARFRFEKELDLRKSFKVLVDEVLSW